jgi:hypothetical protein
MKKIYTTLGFVFLSFYLSFATTYYVSTSGKDSNAGTSISAPFATLQKANNVAVAGDVVYVRGGTYNITNSNVTLVNANGTTVAEANALYACGIKLSSSGTSSAPIKYYNYSNEKPIFNFSGISKRLRITGILVTGSYIVLKGIEIVNVPTILTITDTQSECIRNTGSNNKYERIVMHDSQAIGFYLSKGSNNLVLNCDAYNLWDNVSGAKKGENSDGFGMHPAAGGTGNVFRGCRAWFCADDGYDLISAFEAVTIDNCWAFYNGYSSGYASLANGNGFKGGGYGLAPAKLPASIPRHVIMRCLSVGNKANGFYANHHPGGTSWYNNTAYDNGVNYNMLSGTVSGSNGSYKITDCAGYNIYINNNISHFSANSNTHIPKSGVAIANLNTSSGSTGYNTFSMSNVKVSDADFQSLDLSQLTSARNATDGSLPVITCLNLATSSDLIGAGIVVRGVSYKGSKPDLGCFETTSTKSDIIDESNDKISNTFTAYPNPVSSVLTFTGVEDNSSIAVFDIQGVIVMESQQTQIDLSNLKPGVYFARNNGRTLKIIKK